MNDPAQVLLISSVGIAVVIAGLLGIAPRPEASTGRRRMRRRRVEILFGWTGLRELARRARSSRGGDVEDLRSSAGSLLHQYAALLQSGRSQAQAWTDLSAHWRSREDSHPLAQICVRAAAAEHAGLGAVVGLKRSRSLLASGHRARAGPWFWNMVTTRSRSSSGSPANGRDGAEAGADVGNVPGVGADATVVLTEVLQRLISIHALSQSTGAPLSRLCRKAADSLQDSAALDAAVRTAAAGPRLTQFILAALPVGGVAMGALMGARPLSVLFGSTLGWGCLVAGLGCMFLGWRWSTRLISTVTPHG